MSTMFSRFGRLVVTLLGAGPASVDPDTMSLRDWADLPAHHPSGDRAPC